MVPKPSSVSLPAAGAVVVGLVLLAVARGEPAAEAIRPSGPEAGARAAVGGLAIERARDQARILHRTYDAALRTIHRKYFDADEKEAIPARALEDVFLEVDQETGRTTRWIAVNAPAMNVDHEPRDGFEKSAAAALAAGEQEFERVDGDVYSWAGEIRLVASCLRCHLSGLTQKVKQDRVAGLVISIPLEAN